MGIMVTYIVDTSPLEAFIASAPGADHAVAQALADDILRGAQGYAPVDTGFLRDTITEVVAGSAFIVIAPAPYAGYQEFGTRFQPGTPFMAPAVDELDLQEIAASVALAYMGMGI